MNIHKNILLSCLISVFLFLLFSCDTNNNSKSKQDKAYNKQAKINKNKKEAKLLVSVSKNYINLINYSNYIKAKDSLTLETKSLLDTFNVDITNHLKNLKELSREELVLIPDKNDVLVLDDKTFTKDGEEKRQKKYLEKINDMVETQINLIDELTETSNNSSINALANEAEEILLEHKENFESIIEKIN